MFEVGSEGRAHGVGKERRDMHAKVSGAVMTCGQVIMAPVARAVAETPTDEEKGFD